MSLIPKKSKPVILVLCDYYLPGYKGGGALRTIVNMVERLRSVYDFCIITRDHDGPDDKTPYSNIQLNEWVEYQNTKVFYISPDKIRFKKIKELILDASPDAIYLNSCFSTLTINALILKRMGLTKNIPIILAPEGELADGALTLKAAKKKNFLKLARLFNLYSGLIWKAAAEGEKSDLARLRKTEDPVFIAPNMPPREIYPEYRQDEKLHKEKGEAKFVFLSRFARVKNFKWLLENLYDIKGLVRIDVFGPLEDEQYFRECKEIALTLSENIKINFEGTLPFENVIDTLYKYHFFMLPTLGENFGHVFLEALSAGCPLLISDRTPWQNLEEKNIGWDLPLENPDQWRKTINDCLNMTNDKYQVMSASARSFAENWLADVKHEAATKHVLEFALSSNRGANS